MKLRNIYILLIAGIMLILSIPLLIFLKFNKNEKLIVWFMRVFTKNLNRAAGNQIFVEGLENIDTEENFLLVSNHESMYDIVNQVVYFNKPIGYVSKKENGYIPIFTSWMKVLDSVFLDRKDIRKATKDIGVAANVIKEKHSLAIMPEGTRNTQRMEFKAGSLKIAQKAKCSIVPCTVINTASMFENRKTNKRQQSRVIFHKPIPYEEYKNMSMVELAKSVEDIVYNSYDMKGLDEG